MSVKQMAIVWDLDLPTTKKMVLLAIADHADDEGDNAWPSMARLGKKVGIDVRSVRRYIAELEEQGYLSRQIQGGGHRDMADTSRPNRYRLHLPPDTSALPPRTPMSSPPGHPRPGPPDTHVRQTIIRTSENHPLGEIAESLAKVCGLWPERMTPSARRGLEAAAKELEGIGAGCQGVEDTAKAFRAKWPDALLTPAAIAKWYGSLPGKERVRRPSRGLSGQPCGPCDGTGWAKPAPGHLGPSVLRTCDACQGTGRLAPDPDAA